MQYNDSNCAQSRSMEIVFWQYVIFFVLHIFKKTICILYLLEFVMLQVHSNPWLSTNSVHDFDSKCQCVSVKLLWYEKKEVIIQLYNLE